MDPIATRHKEDQGLTVWHRVRPVWTRNQTARWLNERSPAVLAWLRRHRAGPGRISSSMGRWLQTHKPGVFSAAHRRLVSGTPADRNLLTTAEVLEP